MHLVNPPPSSHTQGKKCITIIFDFACRLILGDLRAYSWGKGKSSWLSTQEKWNQWLCQIWSGGWGGGGGQTRCTNYGYVKIVIFFENASLSFLHRWTKTEVINTMISFIIQRMLVFTLSMWGWNLAISRRRGAVPTKKCTKTCAALGKVVVLLI